MTELTPDKYLLIIQNAAPYSGSGAQEALDLVLATAAFDTPVRFLLQGDACYQLIDPVQPGKNGRKALLKMMKALPIYGVDEILVDRADAETRGINPDASGLPVQTLSAGEVRELLRNAHQVIRF